MTGNPLALPMDMELRRRTLGGSDLARIVGLSSFGHGVLDHWRWMTRKIELPQPSEAARYRMQRGLELEPFLRCTYVARSGRHVDVPAAQQPVKHGPDWLRVSLDGLVRKAIGDGYDRVLEIKTTSFSPWSSPDWIAQWGKTGTDEIPLGYVPQVQVYGWAAQLLEVDIAADVSGDFRIYTLPVDKSYVEDVLLPAGDAFMECVRRDEPPRMTQ